MVFKHNPNKDKDEKKKDKDRLKNEKKEKEKEDKDRKRAATNLPVTTSSPGAPAPPARKETAEKISERSLSGTNLAGGVGSPIRPSSPPPEPTRSASSSNVSPLGASVDSNDTSSQSSQPDLVSTSSSHSIGAGGVGGLSSPVPAEEKGKSAFSPVGSAPPASSSNALYSNASSSSSPYGFGANELSKSGSKSLGQDPAALLKQKIATLPADSRQLVEYLLNIFSRTLPPGWTAPAGLDAPTLEGQIDTTVDKLVEASEILFNKDTQAMLVRYGKELRESPHRRTDKWKIIANVISDDEEFLALFLTSSILESVVVSALARPLEDEESEILVDLLRVALIQDIGLKELQAVLQTTSQSNAHVSILFDEAEHKSLTDAIVLLVDSFKNLSSSPDEEIAVQDLSAKKDAEVSDSINQSVALLQHANTISHAKKGHDIIKPLEQYFSQLIHTEVKNGERWASTGKQVEVEKTRHLAEIDEFVKEEETKLEGVQNEIKDLEAKLEQKRNEERDLQETLANKLAEREAYVKQSEMDESNLKEQLDKTAAILDHHKKSEEAVLKFSQDVSGILDREVNETLKKTKEVLQELDKEVTFLEEKMVTYERSISLFTAHDEPEVLDGLRKLFARSTAIYSESKQSVSRVTGVVELLRTVLGQKAAPVEEIHANLEKIIARQNALNSKYKLQKD